MLLAVEGSSCLYFFFLVAVPLLAVIQPETCNYICQSYRHNLVLQCIFPDIDAQFVRWNLPNQTLVNFDNIDGHTEDRTYLMNGIVTVSVSAMMYTSYACNVIDANGIRHISNTVGQEGKHNIV